MIRKNAVPIERMGRGIQYEYFRSTCQSYMKDYVIYTQHNCYRMNIK